MKPLHWTVCENVRAQMHVLVKRILRYRTSRRKLLEQCWCRQKCCHRNGWLWLERWFYSVL